MKAQTELVVWQVVTMLVAVGCGIGSFALGPTAFIMSFIGLGASFFAYMVMPKGAKGWAVAAAVLNGAAIFVVGLNAA